MNIFTGKEIVNGAGYLSNVNRADLELKDDAEYIMFAYTDYGGDFIDKVYIEYLKENYSDKIVYEDTSYYGQNCIVTDTELAREIIEAVNGYALGFDDVEMFYSDMEYQAYIEMAEYFIKWTNYGKNTEAVKDWILENKFGYYNVLPSGVDYCESNLIDELVEAGYNIID